MKFKNKTHQRSLNLAVKNIEKYTGQTLKVTSSGGKVALVSAREVTGEEPRSLLSGSYDIVEEVIAKSSPEILEYFRQAFRTRQSLGVLTPALLSVSQNGYSLNCIILPHSQAVDKMHVFSNETLVVLTDSNHGKEVSFE